MKSNPKVREAVGLILAIVAIALSLSITGHSFQRARTADALSPVAQVFVTKQNGDVERVIVSSGVHTVIAIPGSERLTVSHSNRRANCW